MVEDFITAPGDPGSVNSSTAFLRRPFKMWSPAQTALSDPATLAKASFKLPRLPTATVGACRTSDLFAIRILRAVCRRQMAPSEWYSAIELAPGPRNRATPLRITLQRRSRQFQSFCEYRHGGTISRRSRYLGAAMVPHYCHRAKMVGMAIANHLDAVWEHYARRHMEDSHSQVGATRTVNRLPAAQRFKGFGSGPNYWGKTFLRLATQSTMGQPDGGTALGGSVNPQR